MDFDDMGINQSELDKYMGKDGKEKEEEPT